MKRNLKKWSLIKSLIMGLSLIMVVSACEKDAETESKGVSLKFKSTYDTTKSSNLKNAIAGEVVIESFKINIEEIELEFDDDDPLFANDSIASDYELEGPFEIDLMKEGNTLETTIVKNVTLPTAAYDEIEFEFSENEDPNSEMFDKSLLVKGTIGGKRFVFWTDENVELEIEFENNVLLQKVKEEIITVSLDITGLFNPALGGIDITTAIDGNEDGTIEISPEDPDGNSDLADHLWDTLENSIEAFEDSFDDDDDDDDNDDEDDED